MAAFDVGNSKPPAHAWGLPVASRLLILNKATVEARPDTVLHAWLWCSQSCSGIGCWLLHVIHSPSPASAQSDAALGFFFPWMTKGLIAESQTCISWTLAERCSLCQVDRLTARLGDICRREHTAINRQVGLHPKFYRIN